MNATVPALAATVVVIREGVDDIEFFMVQRHSRSGFMAGAHVFPGGKLEESDREWAQALPQTEQNRAAALLDHRLDPLDAAAFALAAIRETAEECGILLAQDEMARPASPEIAQQVFQALQKEAALVDEMQRFGLEPSLGALAPWAWWLTPSAEPRRFDTRFFLARVPANQQATADMRETVAGAWFSPQGALDAYENGKIHLAPPTLATIEDLLGCSRYADAEKVPVRPIQCICPKRVEDAESLVLALPGDPLHDETERVQRSARTRIIRNADGRFQSLSYDGTSTSDG